MSRLCHSIEGVDYVNSQRIIEKMDLSSSPGWWVVPQLIRMQSRVPSNLRPREKSVIELFLDRAAVSGTAKYRPPWTPCCKPNGSLETGRSGELELIERHSLNQFRTKALFLFSSWY